MLRNIVVCQEPPLRVWDQLRVMHRAASEHLNAYFVINTLVWPVILHDCPILEAWRQNIKIASKVINGQTQGPLQEVFLWEQQLPHNTEFFHK